MLSLLVSCGVCNWQQKAPEKSFSYFVTEKPSTLHHPQHYDYD